MKKLIALFSLLTLTSSALAQDYRVVKVTSLADSGAGSLRACVEASGPRACVFEVAGRIPLKSTLTVKRSDLRISGQTAPAPGVLITNSTVSVEANNVILEHLEIRPGDEPSGTKPIERDGVKVSGSRSNVTFRNLSVSWGVDENLSTYGKVKNVRVENCIIAQGLRHSIHPPDSEKERLTGHSMGAIVGEGARGVSFVGNLFAHNNDRNVRWKFDTSGEMVGNVIYNWGGTTSWNTTNASASVKDNKAIKLDIIGNVYIPGNNSFASAWGVYSERVPRGSLFYLFDNLGPTRRVGDPESAIGNIPASFLSATRVGGATLQRQFAAETEIAVLASVGARPWDRSAEDEILLEQVRTRTGGIIDAIPGWPMTPENRRMINAPAVIKKEELDAWLGTFEAVATPTPTPEPTATATPAPTATPSLLPLKEAAEEGMEAIERYIEALEER